MKMFKKILVPLDLHESADTENVVKTAVEFATKFGSELTLVNVVDVEFDSPMLDRFKDVQSKYTSSAKMQLEDVIKERIPAGIKTDYKVMSGRSYSKVIAAAEELNADLIIVAAHKTGMKEFLLGMTAARVVRHAECSVLVVRDNDR